MSYVEPFALITPPGATTPVSQLDDFIRQLKRAIAERLEDRFGGDLTADPWVISKVADAISISSKIAYVPEYNAGNSGATLTLNLTTNGPNQKLVLTAACTFTIATPVAGTSGVIRTVQNGSGGNNITWPTNVNFQNDSAPFVTTTASTATLYSYYSDGTVIYMAVFGTNFSVV